MSIWNQITRLAHLKMSEEEKNFIFPQVQNIINFFHHISQIPTEGIEPLITPIDEPIALRNDNQQEADKETLNQKKQVEMHLLKQCPSLNKNFVQVPLVIDLDP